MRLLNLILVVIQLQLCTRPAQAYTGLTHIRIRWHVRNMMQGLVYDGLRRAETVHQYMRFYEASDHWYTGKLAAIIRSKAAKMWNLLERGWKQVDALTVNQHVMILDEMTGLGLEVDKLTEVMERYLAAGGRAGLKAAKQAQKAANKKVERRHLEQIIRQNDPGHIAEGDVKGLNHGERAVLRVLQSFQLKRLHAQAPQRSPLDGAGGGFDSDEYHDLEGFR